MNFLRKIFSKTTYVSPGNVEKAIELVGGAEFGLSNQQFLQLLTGNGIPEPEAIEILIFLPIAFVRHWLPDVKWSDIYIEKEQEKKFSATDSYLVIEEVTKAYFKNMPDPDAIAKIGSRSAEFHAINQLMRDNPNTRLADIAFSPSVIMR